MMVTFRSSASPDIKMLRDLAEYLLGLVGKGLEVRGVILPDDLPAAIARLEQAIDEENVREHAHERSTQMLHADVQPLPGGLAQRAWPLLEMMREASKHGQHVMWGV
ncbi:DUF1840 domain-containing protein [Burkholderia sp. Bp8963]|uniref:DUF1840 domain-containing protein n=1 Tax=Burkholderia sp. Bp8963 TaxID=2184547 RepID=UPI000F5A56E8|nr:DUF1840 domain-containing protein [Burkholderia sp. Bp8963]RQS65520.1 DUF1840 domain-containing protein [Burkholderia sp. Bp8963]